MNEYACPECMGNEFMTSGSVSFQGGLRITEEGTFHYDEEPHWESARTTYIECIDCGWGVELDGTFIVERDLVAVLDRDEEDLPDEEEPKAEVSANVEEDERTNVLNPL